MKIYKSQIQGCMDCPNRKVEDRTAKSKWVTVHICSAENKVIEEVDMDLNKETVKEVKIYKMGFTPDWCPLENCE